MAAPPPLEAAPGGLRSRSRPPDGGAGEGGGAPEAAPVRGEPESGSGLEFVLDCTFEACDPQQTGRVPPARVLQYLAAVTGRSAGERRLRALGAMLEAAGAGAALERGPFHRVMARWVQGCRRGSWLGEEPEAAAGDLGAAEEAPAAPDTEQGAAPGPQALQLQARAQLLATHNRKLQRDAEVSEELNTRLGEELQQLRGQLRSTQQALERARAASEELEDTKAAVKGLEEQNLELRRRMRALEKEQSALRSRADGLQEENQQLHSEGLELRSRLQALVAEVTLLEAQLCRCSELLLSHEATATQAGQRVAELTAALEEYETAVREQRLEATQLRHQLDQLQESCGLQLWSPFSDTPMGQEEAEGCGDSSGSTSNTSNSNGSTRDTNGTAAGTATSAPSIPSGKPSAPSAPSIPSGKPSAPRGAAAGAAPGAPPAGAPEAALGAGAGAAAAAALGGLSPGAAAAAPPGPPRMTPPEPPHSPQNHLIAPP